MFVALSSDSSMVYYLLNLVYGIGLCTFFLLSLLDDFQLGVGIERFLGSVQATKLLLLYSCISVSSTNISKLIFRWVSCKVLLVCLLEGTCPIVIHRYSCKGIFKIWDILLITVRNCSK